MVELAAFAGRPLVPGVDYPSSHRQLVERFGDERACAEFLVGLRWPDGYVCPACGAVGSPWWATPTKVYCAVERRSCLRPPHAG